MTVSTETLEAPKQTEVLGVEITPARVVALLTALSPVFADVAGAWDKMTETQQTILLVIAGLAVLVFLAGNIYYVTKRKVAQLQLETNLAVTGKK